MMLSCAFVGHKDCPKKIEERLYNSVESLIIKNNVSRFYVGTHGNFDYIVYKVLLDLKDKYDIQIFVVLAYLDSRKTYYNQEFTIFPEILETTPKRYAITNRNKFMIDKSQFLICYIENNLTNSYKFFEYAIKKRLEIINLGGYKKTD